MEKRKIDCEMFLTAESSIDGFKIWLYEVKSQLGEIFITFMRINRKSPNNAMIFGKWQ